MPRKQNQVEETPGTQISISDDFDAEAQARLDELIRQAKVSVETKAKQDFQKLKDDTERKRKDSIVAKRAHMSKTHQEELLQRMKAVVVELQEIAQEEEAVITEFIRLTEDDAGKSIFGEAAVALGNAANEMDQVNVGCLTVIENLAGNEKAVSSKLLKGRVDLSKLDSGRNKGNDVAEGQAASEEEYGLEDEEEEPEPIAKPPASKKRKTGNRRR